MLRETSPGCRRWPCLALSLLVLFGCAQGTAPQWRIAVENHSAKTVTVTVAYTIEGGATPGQHTAEEEFAPKKNVEIAGGDGKVTVQSAVFVLGNAKVRTEGEATAQPRQTVVITLGADGKASMRVE